MHTNLFKGKLSCFLNGSSKISQNLKVKSFYGTSPNAVNTQVWIAQWWFTWL